MEGSKPNPFSVFDQLTEARAAMEEEEVERFEVGVDQTQVRRDRQRRERLGQLRAREHESKRPHRVRSAWGYTGLY